MKAVRSFGLFWWDFVVGDDWSVAAAIAVALGLTALLVHGGVDAWWLVPALVAVALGGSLWRAARTATVGG
jgi:hypothetical protein